MLKQVGTELANDPTFGPMLVAQPKVPGIDKVSDNTVDYRMLVKTKPGKQFRVRRELQKRVKATLEANSIQPGDTGSITVAPTLPKSA